MATHACPVCRSTYDAPEEEIGEPCPACWERGWRKGGGGNLFLDRVVVEARIWNDGLEQLERAGDLLAAAGDVVRYEAAILEREISATLHADVGGHAFAARVDEWLRFRWPEKRR